MIDIVNLTKTFEENVALNNISATIPDGMICGLAGSNGSGKSTLLRLLCGVYQPDGGEIVIDKENSFENIKIKGECYYISDYPFFSNGATVNKIAGYLSQIYPNWDDEYFKRMCKCFPINPMGKIINMSKGMQRQAALILAFSTRPKYLFLDEIFDGLDPVIRQTLKKLVIENVCENNMTAVIASHNLREFDDICDMMILLHNGSVVKDADVDNLKSSAFKIQVAFNDEVTPEIFKSIPVRNLVQRGRYFTFIAEGEEDALKSSLAVLNPVFVEIMPLTLEEIFINEMGGVGYETK